MEENKNKLQLQLKFAEMISPSASGLSWACMNPMQAISELWGHRAHSTLVLVFRAHKVAFTGEKNPRLAAEKVPEGQLRLGLCKWQSIMQIHFDKTASTRVAISSNSACLRGHRASSLFLAAVDCFACFYCMLSSQLRVDSAVGACLPDCAARTLALPHYARAPAACPTVSCVTRAFLFLSSLLSPCTRTQKSADL